MPAPAAARTSAKPSSSCVRPLRSSAVRLEPTSRRAEAISVTVAEPPTAARTRVATAPGELPPVSIRKDPTASLLVACAM